MQISGTQLMRYCVMGLAFGLPLPGFPHIFSQIDAKVLLKNGLLSIMDSQTRWLFDAMKIDHQNFGNC